MIGLEVATLASVAWIATTLLWRATNTRRRAALIQAQPKRKGFRSTVLGLNSSVTVPNRCYASRPQDHEIDHSVVRLPALIGCSPEGRRGRPERRDVCQALITSGIFRKTDPGVVSALSEQLKPVAFPPGHVIGAQSNFGGRLFVIISGIVKISYLRPDGSEIVLTLRGSSDIFGATTLFDPGSREITVTALGEVLAVPIQRDQLLVWMVEYPEVRDQVLRLFARWTKATMTTLADFAFADVQSRVASRLLLLRKRFGRQEGEVVRIVHDLTLADLSLLVGVAPEVIRATLRDFENRGWIRVADNSLLVIDSQALASVRPMKVREASCA